MIGNSSWRAYPSKAWTRQALRRCDPCTVRGRCQITAYDRRGERSFGLTVTSAESWEKQVFDALRRGGIEQIAYVPDAGHSYAIRAAQSYPAILDVVLTTEEEGVGVVAGAWLGGQRAALLMQSSGVGNCINMFTLLENCQFPFLTLVTMRGEFAEFNPWQAP